MKTLKNSWDRKEIYELFKKFGQEATNKQCVLKHLSSEFVADQLEIDKFLNKNL